MTLPLESSATPLVNSIQEAWDLYKVRWSLQYIQKNPLSRLSQPSPQVHTQDMIHRDGLMASIGDRLQPLLQESSDAVAACEMIFNVKSPLHPLLYAAVVEAELKERLAENRDKKEKDKRMKLKEFEKLPEGIHQALSSLLRFKALSSTNQEDKALLSRLLQVWFMNPFLSAYSDLNNVCR